MADLSLPASAALSLRLAPDIGKCVGVYQEFERWLLFKM